MPDDQSNGQNPNDINPFKKPEDARDESQAFTMPDPIPANDTSVASEPETPAVDASLDTTAPAEDSNNTTEPTSSPAVDSAPLSALPAFETEPATQPAAMPAMSETTFAQPSSKKSKKGLIISGAIAAFFVLSLGGSVAAYNLWYQNPDKVLVDSVVNAIKAKTVKVDGTFTWQNDDVALTVTPNIQAKETAGMMSASVKLNSKSEETKALDGTKMNADFVIEKSGTAYFRLTDLKKNFDKAADALIEEQIKQYESSGIAMTEAEKAQAEQMVKGMYEPIIEKLDNQWIKLDADKESSSSDNRKCIADAYKKFSNDDLAKEVGNVYQEHKFVTVKDRLEDKDGSLGYELELNEEKAKEFGKAFEKTNIGKELAKCDEDMSTDFDSSDDDEFKSSSFKVWISRWSHELTHVSFEATMKDEAAGSFKGEFNTQFNQNVEVTVPKDAKTFDEIFEGFDPFGMGTAEATDIPVEV